MHTYICANTIHMYTYMYNMKGYMHKNLLLRASGAVVIFKKLNKAKKD